MENTANRFDKLLQTIIGLSTETIQQQSAEESDHFIEKEQGIQLRLGDIRRRILYRGNPLMDAGRIIEDVDNKFDHRFGISE